MAFERFSDILRGGEKERPGKDAEKERASERGPEHAGIGKPLQEATALVRDIAHEMAENEKNMQRARQEGNLTRVRELQEHQRSLSTKRSKILQDAAVNRTRELKKFS